MKTKQLIFLFTMALSVIGFNENSFGFDLGGALNSITKELEKGAKELEKGLQQGDLGEPPGQAQQQNNTKKLSSVEMEIEFKKSELPKRNKNWSRVLEIVKPLAEQGHAGSQGRLGGLYLHGLGIEKKPAEALKWLSLSAKQGDIKAEFNLGQLYQKGIGVPKDVNEAIKWFTLAADKGHKKSQTQLGVIYFSSKDGIQPNDAKAFKYFSLAAKQGDKNSEYGLGFLYEYGVHVPINKQESIKWYKLAADQGHSKAKQFLEKLTKEAKATEVLTKVEKKDYVQVFINREGKRILTSDKLDEIRMSRKCVKCDLRGLKNIKETFLMYGVSNFEGANLSKLDFVGASLVRKNFSGANLSGAKLLRISANDIIFKGANLEGAHLNSAFLMKGNLDGANLEGANLSGANLEKASLLNTNLKGASLRGTKIKRMIINQKTLENADLSNTNGLPERWEELNFSDVILTGSSIEEKLKEKQKALLAANKKAKEEQRMALSPNKREYFGDPKTNLMKLKMTKDCSKCNLTGANLEGTDLRGANLEGASLKDANLKGANLSGANLNSVILDGATIEGVITRDETQSNQIKEIYKYSDPLGGALLAGSFNKRTSMNDTDWTKLRGLLPKNLYVSLAGANLSKVDLSGARMYGTNFSGANLIGVNFEGAQLGSSIFFESVLSEANLKGAKLNSSYMSGAVLDEANLKDANLEDAKLEGASFIRANVIGANLQGAKLNGTNFKDAKMDGTTNLGSPGQLISNESATLCKTILPWGEENKHCDLCIEKKDLSRWQAFRNGHSNHKGLSLEEAFEGLCFGTMVETKRGNTDVIRLHSGVPCEKAECRADWRRGPIK